MDFKDLEYIALEGGGGKGAVYKGAIEALEKLFFNDPNLDLIQGVENIPISVRKSSTPNHYPSFLSYVSKDNKKLKLKGIAGTSAGSINAFTLAIGLTSKDIEDILNSFPFDEFLTQIDSGKYRMVSSKKNHGAKEISKSNPFNIYIGEDKKKKLGDGDGVKEYIFQKDKIVNVQNSLIKGGFRLTLISLIIKIIITGIIESLHDLLNFWKKTSVKEFQNSTISNSVDTIFDSLAVLKKKNGSNISIVTVDNILLWLLKKAFSKKAPMLKLISIKSIANYLFDGGLYSGFIVREFFCNCLLYSLTKDTYCKEGWNHYILNKGSVPNRDKNDNLPELSEIKKKEVKDIINKIKLKPEHFKNPKGKFRDCTLAPEIIDQLYKVSFKEFYKITNLNLVICSTNVTYSEPMYFSHEWTPDFPVLEAVGMSMCIPPAFKPVYNEANVIYQENELTKFTVGGDEFVIFDNNGKFNESNHLRLVLEVMKKIKEKDETKGFTVNTSLSFSNYLPYLRDLIDETEDPTKKSEYVYIYNSSYKGMFMDGGVTNNIPYNAFRIKENSNIDKTLALKVDNNYPLEEQMELLKLYKEYKEEKLAISSNMTSAENWDALEKVLYYKYSSAFAKLFKNFENTFDEKQMNIESFSKTLDTLKIIDDTLNDNLRPWEKRVFGLSALLDGLQYGFDKGQVRTLNDNNHILPLYCYGVGTYDFDLYSLNFLTKFANIKSEKDTKIFFESTNK